MFSVYMYLSSYKSTPGSLGEPENAMETLACQLVVP